MSARLVFLVSLWLCSALGHPITVFSRQSSRPTDDVLAGEDFLSFFSDGDKPQALPRPAPRLASETSSGYRSNYLAAGTHAADTSEFNQWFSRFPAAEPSATPRFIPKKIATGESSENTRFSSRLANAEPSTASRFVPAITATESSDTSRHTSRIANGDLLDVSRPNTRIGNSGSLEASLFAPRNTNTESPIASRYVPRVASGESRDATLFVPRNTHSKSQDISRFISRPVNTEIPETSRFTAGITTTDPPDTARFVSGIAATESSNFPQSASVESEGSRLFGNKLSNRKKNIYQNSQKQKFEVSTYRNTHKPREFDLLFSTPVPNSIPSSSQKYFSPQNDPSTNLKIRDSSTTEFVTTEYVTKVESTDPQIENTQIPHENNDIIDTNVQVEDNKLQAPTETPKVVSVSISSSVTKNMKTDSSMKKKSDSAPDIQEVPAPTALQRSSLNIEESEEYVKLGRQDILRVTNSPRFRESATSIRTSSSTGQRKPSSVPKAHVNNPEDSAAVDYRPISQPPATGNTRADTKSLQFPISTPEARSFKLGRTENKFEKPASEYEEGYEYDSSQDPVGYDEPRESDKNTKLLLKPKSNTAAQTLPVVYSEPAKVYSEPAKVYGEPAKVYGEPAKVYGEPAKVYGEPAKVYGEPAKVYGEPAKVYGEPARIYGEPAKVYGEPEKVYSEQGKPKETTEKAGEKKESSQAGHVLETKNYKKYRVEEKTPDGFIVGEYGVLSHDGGSLRGVRYTADSDTNPSLIYDALVKFLALQ